MGKKIVISESQYRRVFLSENTAPIIDDGLSVYESESIVVEQYDKPTEKFDLPNINFDIYEPGTDDNYEIIPNERLELSKLIPNTKIDPCRPSGLFGYASEGMDWCKIMSSSNIDCYMGHCTVKVDGFTYTWPQTNRFEPSNKDYQLILNQNYKDFNNYILNFNKNIDKWNTLKKLSKWGGKAILIDDEWLNKNSNNLQNWFDRNSYLGFNYVGVGTTNIFNPGWLIQKYIEFETAMEFDIQSILKQEEFKARVREAQKEYNKKVETYQKQMEVWRKYVSDIYDQRREMYVGFTYAQNNMYHPIYNVNVRQEENYPEPIRIPKINIDLFKVDNNNPYGGKSTTLLNKTDEEKFIDTYDYEPKLKPEGGKEGIKKFQDWLDSKNLKWVDGANLNKGPGYGNWGPKTKSLWPIYGVIYEWESNFDFYNKKIPDMPKMPDTPNILGDDYVRKDLSEIELAMESFKVLLSAIDSFNSVFESQNYNDTVEFCNTRGIRTQFGPRPKSSAILVNKGTKNAEYLYWYFDICPKEGGVWVYSQGPNSKSCACVRTSRQDMLYSDGRVYNYADTLKHRLETTDLRSGWEKLSDWASGCMDDWHCLADIASIAVLFIPVPGLNVGLSAAIDLVSAAGYAIEGDEGWELNAGLTLIGSFASGIDAIKYVNKGLKGGSEITKLRKALGDGLEKAEKVKLTPEWSKLDKVGQSKLYSKEFRKSLKGLSSKEIKELSNIMTSFSKSGDELAKSVKEIVGDLSNVSKQEKAGLQDILDKMSKDDGLKREIADHIIANGGKVDVKSIIKKFGKQSIVKDALIQSTLFILMQRYPEETAKAIIGGLELFKMLTGVDLLSKLSNKDKDPNDQETMDVDELIASFKDYEIIVNHVMSFIESTDQKEIAEKYGVNLFDLKEKIFNSEDPLFPDQLRELSVLIESFINEINKKESESPVESPENIKLFVEDLYNKLLSFIEEDQKSEENIKLLWDNYKNNPPDNADHVIDDYEEFRELEKEWEMINDL